MKKHLFLVILIVFLAVTAGFILLKDRKDSPSFDKWKENWENQRLK